MENDCDGNLRAYSQRRIVGSMTSRVVAGMAAPPAEPLFLLEPPERPTKENGAVPPKIAFTISLPEL